MRFKGVKTPKIQKHTLNLIVSVVYGDIVIKKESIAKKDGIYHCNLIDFIEELVYETYRKCRTNRFMFNTKWK